MSPIKISPFQKGQEVLVHNLIKKVYDEFVSIDYTKEGNDFFYDGIKPSHIADRQSKQINILVAMDDSQIVGMIEVRNNNTISLLFVNKDYQGKGIAGNLFREALKIYKQRNPNLDKFYVHASPFSIPIYKKLGFVETDVMQEENGIKYLPMEMTI